MERVSVFWTAQRQLCCVLANDRRSKRGRWAESAGRRIQWRQAAANSLCCLSVEDLLSAAALIISAVEAIGISAADTLICSNSFCLSSELQHPRLHTHIYVSCSRLLQWTLPLFPPFFFLHCVAEPLSPLVKHWTIIWGAMSPGCMLLFVFGFVGGAVVINSAVLVSLSVLLLVHYSVSTRGLPDLPSIPSIPKHTRYKLYVWYFTT